MKIAVPTSDRYKVFERTGHATFYAVFTIEQSNITHIDFRENPLQVHTGGEHSYKEMVTLLHDCDLILVQKIGKSVVAELTTAGIQYKITKVSLIGEAIHQYLSG